MTKANITQYSSTPSSNADINDINIAENCPASGLNNAIRELMAHLKNVDTGSQALTALSVTGALSAKGGAVFNEDSADVDFRVESNDDANIFRIEGATNNVKIGSNAGDYGQLSIKNEKAGSQERGLYVECTPASGTSPNNVAVFSATNSNMTQPLVRIHHESPTADQLLLQATTTGSNTVKFSVDEDGDIYSAGGVFLGGTGTANKISDYEEGTFNISSAGSGYTISAQGGKYTKIGDTVHCNFTLTFSAVNSGATSNVTVSTLPFTCGSFQSNGTIRESTNTGVIYVINVPPSGNDFSICSMDGVGNGNQRTIRVNENYIGSFTYKV